jgi:Rod binding domain-containing protein
VIGIPGIQALRAAQLPAAQPAGTAGAGAAGGTGAAGTGANAEIEKAAKEGIFMSMLVNEMFKGTDLAGGQSGYGGLITEKFGDALAESGGMGLAAILTRQLGGEA